jgi:MFS family permease
MKLPSSLLFLDFSQTVHFLSLSDSMQVAALGLFGPIFAIFISEQIQTDRALEVIGIGTSIFLFTRSIGQIPLAFFIDKIKGERDDFIILLVGNTIFIIVPLLYLLISEPWHLFLIQFIFGLGAALTSPTWLAIFTRHIDKGKEGIEWGVYQTLSDMGGAVAAPIGGFLAAFYGFTVVMICSSLFSVASSVFIFLIRDDLNKK